MDQWAIYLRSQARVLGLPVIDTTMLTVAEAAARLEELTRTLG